jgi:membrane protein DedA with SNARE-associated domain
VRCRRPSAARWTRCRCATARRWPPPWSGHRRPPRCRIGRLLRRPIERRYGQSPAWLRAEAYFARRAAIAIFLTRCLLTPIALPINLIAGSSDYPLARFVTYVGAGELTWLLGYGALGYLFGSQWESVSELIGNASGLLVGLVIAGAGAYTLIRWQRRPAPALAEPDTSLG